MKITITPAMRTALETAVGLFEDCWRGDEHEYAAVGMRCGIRGDELTLPDRADVAELWVSFILDELNGADNRAWAAEKGSDERKFAFLDRAALTRLWDALFDHQHALA